MRCPRCGSEVSENAKFCPKCGNVMKITCPSCGRIHPAGTKFCSGCGTTLQSDSETGGQGINGSQFQKQGGVNPPPRRGKTGLVIFLVIFGICMVGAVGTGAYFFLRPQPKTVMVGSREKKEEIKETEKQTEKAKTAAEETSSMGMESLPSTEPNVPTTPAYIPPTTAYVPPTTAYVPPANQPTFSGNIPQTAPAVQSSDYVMPYSSSRYLTSADFAGFTKDQLRLARNEIYARHGRTFSDQDLQNYFNSKTWYYGTVAPENFNANVLNDYEKKNLLLIKDIEKLFN
ncbi:YARHG domain-containing protein [Clostridium sp. AM58-1XD]|uniref:YARHG domain-containing protein n=1 Tax=Clostridium sp. AM58-1XD TaxID=2292307 RepID=UPI000E555D61|nr:YARHG domain-containing protein [Clostridium sp. AM58-1XD]RGZ00658.1 YARHG domain-containing protein [Clostridium sp. AM58-1XD]